MASSTVKTRRRSLSDPLQAALLPPPNESASERERRLKAELEAKKISDDIDEMIKAEKNGKRKSKSIKVLLLGQSESGKSTTLKRTYRVFFSASQVLMSISFPQNFSCCIRQPLFTQNALPGVLSST